MTLPNAGGSLFPARGVELPGHDVLGAHAFGDSGRAQEVEIKAIRALDEFLQARVMNTEEGLLVQR